MSGKYWCLKKTYTGHSSKKCIFVSFSSTQNGHATLRTVGEKQCWWTLIWDTLILNWTKTSCMRPSKEYPHTFPLQSSSYNLCKVTAFHSILGDSTIHGKKNCTTFLLVHRKRSCHSHNQTATPVQIHYSTKIILYVWYPCCFYLYFAFLITFCMIFLSKGYPFVWTVSTSTWQIWL